MHSSTHSPSLPANNSHAISGAIDAVNMAAPRESSVAELRALVTPSRNSNETVYKLANDWHDVLDCGRADMAGNLAVVQGVRHE